MKLSQYAEALADQLVEFRGPDCEITAVANDSRQVTPGCLFCAVAGSHSDGHAFLAAATAAGAAALVVADPAAPLPPGLPVLRVCSGYLAWGILCQTFFDQPAAALKVHAITGTNGKTSTAFALRHLLATAGGKPTALLTTVLTDTAAGEIRPAANTTPDAWHLQELFARIKAGGATEAVMEFSSHGLHQRRAGRICFASAVFTHLTGDHLDYHGTMENYYQAKKLLFTEMTDAGTPLVIHLDNPWSERLYGEMAGRNRYGISFENPAAFCYVQRYSYEVSGTVIHLSFDGHDRVLESPLRGRHNISNLLCAFTAATARGLAVDSLTEAVRTVPPAPGRLEPFRLPSGAHAFVDYAHTDDALIRVLSVLRELRDQAGKGGRILCVFGCGGDRDRTKRPRMGRAASELADSVILTSDNPRSEDPLTILREIRAGIPKTAPAEILVLPDRAEAIRAAAARSGADDWVLIAGKGHETYQEIAGVRHPFDDREIVRALKSGC